MLRKKPSEKIVETTILKQPTKTLHIEDIEAKALELVKQFESRDKFQKLHVAISDVEIAIKRKTSIDAGWYYAPYIPLAELSPTFVEDLKDTDSVTIDPDNPRPWFSSIPAWRPTIPTDVVEVSEPWFAPAGFNRGMLEPTQQSALDDINNKRTYLWVEQRLKEVLEMNLGELNDEITREHICSMIEQSIKPVVYDFAVTCNEMNNPISSIDNGILNVDVSVLLNKDSEFVHIHGNASYHGIECQSTQASLECNAIN